MKKKRLKAKLRIQKRITAAMSAIIQAHHDREDALQRQIMAVKAKSWDVMTSGTGEDEN